MGISCEQALDCFRSDDLVGIGMEADAVRRRLHPEGVVSYAIGCGVDCATALNGVGAAAEGALEGICGEIAGMLEGDGSCVRLAGNFGGGMESAERVVSGIRRRFSAVWIEGFSAKDVVVLAAGGGLSVRDAIARLQDAGLDSIVGDGAEWADVHRAAHGLGMRTVAAIGFGAGETAEQRVDFLDAVRRLQEETGGFAAFVPVAAEAPGGRELDGVTAVERLKTLAIARMFLDNIENVQVSVAGQGLKVLQTALRFGGNDVGSVAVANGGSEEDLRLVIRDAGFRPVQRDVPYRTMFLS